MVKYFIFFLSSIVALAFHSQIYAQDYSIGIDPGKSVVKKISDNTYLLENKVLELEIKTNNQQLMSISVKDILADKKIIWDKTTTNIGYVFANDGKSYSLNNANIKRISIRKNSLTIEANISPINSSFKWIFSLANSDNFIHQELIFLGKPLEKIRLFSLDTMANEVKVVGVVDGSPMFANHLFFSMENPMFQVVSDKNEKMLEYKFADIKDAQTKKLFDIGVVAEGQMRRDFLYYTEKIRARHYHPFLHYNSWFDLSFNADTLKEKACEQRMQKWRDSLVYKRHILLDGFLWDSGWDDFNNLWHFNRFFPDGFSNMNKLAKSFGASNGMWISPWGGYDDALVLRMNAVKKSHIPFKLSANGGFSLSDSVYYSYFATILKNLVREQKTSILKLDGVGAGLKASGPGELYYNDVAAFLRLLKEIRQINPTIYLSVTVGTWPSPMWLCYGDNIWRGGGDMGFLGKGNRRQQWMTYRDADLYNNIVTRAPLYPLNSVMIHGFVYAGKGLATKLDNDIRSFQDDAWMFWSMGPNLQEMYVNPNLLDSEKWDALSKIIAWNKDNTKILEDAHWFGGDPGKGEVYGYASWKEDHGFITIRNPKDKVVSYQLDIEKVLELRPQTKIKSLMLNSIYPDNRPVNDKHLTLAPLEVKVIEVSYPTLK